MRSSVPESDGAAVRESDHGAIEGVADGADGLLVIDVLVGACPGVLSVIADGLVVVERAGLLHEGPSLHDARAVGGHHLVLAGMRGQSENGFRVRMVDLPIRSAGRTNLSKQRPLVLLVALIKHQADAGVTVHIRPALDHKQPFIVHAQTHVIDLQTTAGVLVLGLGDFLLHIADQTASFILLGTVVLDQTAGRRRVEDDALLAGVVDQA